MMTPPPLFAPLMTPLLAVFAPLMTPLLAGLRTGLLGLSI
jgi:hypothetical protein